MTGWYVTSNDIRNWTQTNKRQSEEVLPLLIRKLILASCDPSSYDFPSGDAVAIGGWDGTLEVEEGNQFVPSGVSGWEFGTNDQVKSKADEEYSKRTEKPDPFDTTTTTFVFVTSRLWSKRKAWCAEKIAEDVWCDVQGINSDVIELWLETCPAVHRWFSELIGKRCAEIWDIEQAWSEFSNTTKISLKAEFFLHERKEELDLLTKLISGDAGVHRIKSRSKIEAYGFILSMMLMADMYHSRCLIIKNQKAWDLMTSSTQPLILIPNGFSPNNIGVTVTKGHTVLLPVDDKDTRDTSVILSHQPRLIRQSALQLLGFDENTASKIYQDTKGYIDPILRHDLLEPNDYSKPDWIGDISSEVLFAMLFASSWNEGNENDKNILSELSGISYIELEKSIIKLSKYEDPPVRLVGNVWQVISKMDLWLHIAYMLSRPHLDRLEKILSDVISDNDPSYDLPSDERYMANVKGAIPKYSYRLKRGISDSLSLLSVYGDEYTAQLGGDKPSNKVENWVRKLFDDNLNVQFWYSLKGCLELLTEAAPSVFLDALEKVSTGDDPVILGLFNAEEDGLFGGCYHSDLLWSLEQVSWNKQYLSRVSQCLARLSELDPGGQYGNRPFNSLVDMYLGWINNTSATHDERISIIDNVLVPGYPEISWKLMLNLLIGNSHSTSGISKPEYREWSKDIDRTTTNVEYFKYVRSIVDILFREVEKDLDTRLPDLVKNFDSYNLDQQNTIFKRLLEIRSDHLSDKAREQILIKLKYILSHHREFPDAEWSWPVDLLNRIEEVHIHFDYADAIESNSYLFNDQWPNLIDPINRKEYDHNERARILAEKRAEVVEKVYEEKGVEGIEDIIETVSYPGIVGSTCFDSNISDKFLESAFDWLDKDDSFKSFKSFAESYIRTMAYKDYDKAEKIFLDNESYEPVKKANILLCFPLNENTLLLVDDLKENGKIEYWSKLGQYFVSSDEVKLASKIALGLLKYDRPLAAVDALAQIFYGRGDTSELDSELVTSILIKIATDPTDIDRVSIQGVQHDILKALNFIQDSGDIDEDEVAQIEWAFIKVPHLEKTAPPYLSKKIIESPTFFTELVMWVYKRKDDENDPDEDITPEQLKVRAERAYSLLRSLSLLPGATGASIESKTLNAWVDEVRKQLSDCGRKEIGDDRIGDFLSHSPEGDDGLWPHEAVRDVIERIKSPEVDEAMTVGKRNSRGVTSRSLYAGGLQERVLVEKYNRDADTMQILYPRTADILRSIAKGYEWDADREDREIDLRE